ncbi:MAG: bacteriocin [Bauldia litoralis]
MAIPLARTTKRFALVLPIVGLMAACGTNPGDRAVTGGALGAATGAALGAVTGGSVATGAIIGGVSGAALGAFTSPRDVYLGRPIWRRHHR